MWMYNIYLDVHFLKEIMKNEQKNEHDDIVINGGRKCVINKIGI